MFITRESDALGATITGLDLGAPLQDEDASALQQALAEWAPESQAGLARWIEDASSLASGKAA